MRIRGFQKRGFRALADAAALLWIAAAVRCGAAAAPFKGLVLWPEQARAHPELSREISLEFAYVAPSALVSGLGPGGEPRIDWTPLERLLDDIASRGHQAILRFRYEYPGEVTGGVAGATAVPACVKALPGYRETFAADPNGDGPTHYADWSHPGLEDFTLRFFGAFAARYDADPRLAFLEAGFGHWSEWHTFGTPLRLGGNFPSMAFQRAFLRRLAGLFRQTPWLVSIDAADRAHSPAAEPPMAALPFGLFDDAVMHRGHDIAQGDGWNERCWLAFGADRWRCAPAGGEISYFEPGDQRGFLAPGGIHGVAFREAAAKYHVTFMIANDAPEGPFATPEAFRGASAACGYRFRLVSAERRGGAVRFCIANEGVAPVYHDARPAVGGAVSPVSLRGLAPGESMTFTLPLSGDGAAGGGAGDAIEIRSPKLPPGRTLPLERGGDAP